MLKNPVKIIYALGMHKESLCNLKVRCHGTRHVVILVTRYDIVGPKKSSSNFEHV